MNNLDTQVSIKSKSRPDDGEMTIPANRICPGGRGKEEKEKNMGIAVRFQGLSLLK